MRHILDRGNLGLNLTRRLRDPIWGHAYPSFLVTDKTILSSRDNCYFFPLYLYPDQSEEGLFDKKHHKAERISNLNTEFLGVVEEFLGSESSPEKIFYYIYAVLYGPTYRKGYDEFLKIDFPRIPFPSNNKLFEELCVLGKELVELHLVKASALDETDIGFPKDGSRKVEKISFDKDNQRVFINKEEYFEGISYEVWEYRIGAYQVMEKYLKDRKNRKLSLDEINHYMKVTKAIRLTIELQHRIDKVYRNYP
jgi:predicted helicase